MTEYAFGFDPSINDAAWAVVGTDGSVQCGLLRNPYKESKIKLDNWAKLDGMLDLLQDGLDKIVQIIPETKVWVCEGQYASRRGNQEHNIRLGWISAFAYVYGPEYSPRRIIAIPSQWTRNIPKEVRHPELLAKVQPESEWQWVGDPAPPSLMHNIYDGVGLAQWGLEQEGLV